jgi:hypothetical protein
MTTPTINTAPAPVSAKPARRWFAKKRFILPPVAALFFLVGAIAGAAGATGTGAPTAAPVAAAAPVPAVTTTVTSAPPECGTALDLAAKFMVAVGTEHTALGTAFTQVGTTGDMSALSAQIVAAENGLTKTMNSLSAPMAAAAQVCRAALP